ncbi:MAG: hypothetical protein ACRBFS_17395 [Aureispira sp.]
MKYLLLLFFCLFYTPCLLAQTPAFRVGEPYKVIDANKKHYFSDPANNLMLAIKDRNNKITLQRFDLTTLKEVKRSNRIILPNLTYIYDVVRIHGRIYLLQADYTKGRRNLQLFAHQIDPFNCTLVGDRVPVLEGINISQIIIQQRGEDGDVLLLGFRADRMGNNEQRLAHGKVLGKDLTTIGEYQLQFPHKRRQVDIIDYHLDQQGIPYVLTKVRPSNNSHRNIIGRGEHAMINYQLEILKFNLTDGSHTAIPIKLDKQQIESSWLYAGANGQVICTGFYSKRASKTKEPDGIFVFKVDPSAKLLEHRHYEFPIEILTQYKNAGQQSRIARADRKGRAEMNNLKLKKIIIQDDNSLVIIGEIDFVVTSTNTSTNGSTYTRTTYHYYDMLVTKINVDGSLAWMRKLPKRQIGSRGRGSMSFQHVKLNDQHYFLYLDHPKNKIVNVYELPSIYADGRRAILTAYQVNDKTGKAKKAQILDTKKNRSKYKFYQFNIGRVVPSSSSSVVIEFYKKGKQDVLVDLNLK